GEASTECSVWRSHRTSPCSSTCGPRLMLSDSFTSSEACSCSAQETPLQHAVWYPACCRAQRTGAAWSSFGCASTMIFMALSRAGDWERQHAAGAPLVLFQGSVSLLQAVTAFY